MISARDSAPWVNTYPFIIVEYFCIVLLTIDNLVRTRFSAYI